MRVILKPGGVVFVLLSLCLLSAFALVGGQSDSFPYKDHGKLVTATLPPTLVKAGDFEDRFAPYIPVPQATGRINGLLAPSWRDNSSWADLNVFYDRDEANPHGGKAAQKIVVNEVKKGQVQFTQSIPAQMGKMLRYSLWVRAQKPMKVQLALRDEYTYDRFFGQQDFSIDTKWQKLEVTAKITSSNSLMLMLLLPQPGVVWVDDAAVDLVP